MLDYIKGSIKEVNKHYLVIEVKGFGIGLKIYHSNPFLYSIEQEYKILTYLQIKDEERNLFGFIDSYQKALFLHLIEVNGIGPKTAMNILSSDSTDNIILAINNSDINYLKSIGGIGLKTAQQIVITLNGKMKTMDINQSNIYIQTKEALRNLNFKNSEINEVFAKLKNNYSNVNECLKDALVLLRGN